MNRPLIFDQEPSLIDRLEAAGIMHGDTAKITLDGVGVRQRDDRLVLSFCPSSVLRVTVLQQGTPEERRQPIPSRVAVSNNLRRRIFQEAPPHGFVRLHGFVHSNGHIQLSGRITKTEPIDVSFSVHYEESHREFRQLCSAAH